MGVVDQHDWDVEKYPIKIRGKKWYWPLFIRMVDMALVNAWIVYRTVNKSDMPLLTIRRAVTVIYLKLGARTAIGRPITSKTKTFDDVRYDKYGHFMETRTKISTATMRSKTIDLLYKM